MRRCCLLTVAISLLLVSVSYGDVITFDHAYRNLGSYTSNGLLNWDNSWTWNGQPTTETNRPTEYDLQLSTAVSLFTPLAHSNILYVDISDIVSTHLGLAIGATFNALTLTGISLEDDFFLNHPFIYSGANARAGEYLIGTDTGLCANSTTTLLNATPGWTSTLNGNAVTVQTVSGATNGLTGSFGCVWGDYRIQGGALFALTFDEPVNLKRLDIGDLGISVSYGQGRQSINGVLQSESFPPGPPPSVPEPATLILIGSGITAVLIGKRRPACKGSRV
jgi:hypothetical protein